MLQLDKTMSNSNRSQLEKLYKPENIQLSSLNYGQKIFDKLQTNIKMSLKKRIKRDRNKERHNTYFLDAVRKRDLHTCKRLVAQDVDYLNATCHDTGATAIMVSAAWGYENLVSFLLENGASPLAKDFEGRTPAHVASAFGYVKILQVLLEWQHFKDILNSRVNNDDQYEIIPEYFDSWIHEHDSLLPEMPELEKGSTPLHCASQRSHWSCVKLLLDYGANTELCDGRGLTPSDVAGETIHRPDNYIYHDVYIDEDYISSSSFLTPPGSLSMYEGYEFEKEKIDRFESSTRHVIEEIETKRDFNNDETIYIQGSEYKMEDINSVNVRRKKNSGIRLKNCLHTSVKKGDLSSIKYLTRHRFHYVFEQDEQGRTPAHIAVELKDITVLKLLLHLSTVDIQDSSGRSLLYRSAELDWMKGVDFLLNSHCDITKRANDGSTVMHVAAKKSNSKLLEELFTFHDAMQLINEQDLNHKTPLWNAVKESSVPCVEYLLSHDADATIKKPGGITLLHTAVHTGSKEIIKLLLNSEINLLDKSSDESTGGLTPLHIACIEGHVDCTRLLIESGANIFNKTKCVEEPFCGNTALHLAARYGHIDLLEFLIKCNYSIVNYSCIERHVLDQRNANLWQPLHVAARFGKTDCVRFLLKSGSNLSSEIKFADCKNALDMVVNFIPKPIEFLKDIFNSFIYINDTPLTDNGCFVMLKYDLLSPNREGDGKQLSVLNAVINSRKLSLQQVLLHPLAETFIALKWRKLKVVFYLLFAIYCILTASVTAMCLTACTDVLRYISSNYILYRASIVFSLTILSALEILQISQSRHNYWKDWESWVKWITFALAGWLTLPDFEFNHGAPVCFTNISSIAVLFSWVELLLLLSRLPNWGFRVLMFCKVTENILKVLAIFAILFVGFTFSLMIEFRSESPFKDFWLSFTKVIVMTSELEYGDMFEKPIESSLLWSFVARSILLSFVILISIVLMNLMVGIAVDDIKKLKVQGRSCRLAKQVRFLYLIEKLIHDNCLLKFLPKFIREAVKKYINVELHLLYNPYNQERKLFSKYLQNSLMDKASEIKNPEKKDVLLQLKDEIDELIKQKLEGL